MHERSFHYHYGHTNHKYAARNVYVFETLRNSFLADVDGSPMQMTVPAYVFMAPVSSNGTSVNVRFLINDDLRTVTLVGGVAINAVCYPTLDFRLVI